MNSETRRKAAWAAFAIIGASLTVTVPIAGLLGCSQANAQGRSQPPAVEKAPPRIVLTESSPMTWTPSVNATIVHDSASGREWIVFTRGDKFTEVRDVTYPGNDCCHAIHRQDK